MRPQELEYRIAAAKPQRFDVAPKGGGGGLVATGYASAFNQPTHVAIGAKGWEVVRPGAFAAAIKANDMIALHSHDVSKILGRVSAGTLSLSEDSHGLRFVCNLPNSAFGRGIAESMRRGDLNAMSFGFFNSTTQDRWTRGADGQPMRELLSIDCYEVSTVTFPAYSGTKASIAQVADNPFAEQKSAPRDFAMDSLTARLRARELELSGAWNATKTASKPYSPTARNHVDQIVRQADERLNLLARLERFK